MSDDAPSFGFCPSCGCNRPLELDWTCSGCGWDVRVHTTPRLGGDRHELPEEITGIEPWTRRDVKQWFLQYLWLWIVLAMFALAWMLDNVWAPPNP